MKLILYQEKPTQSSSSQPGPIHSLWPWNSAGILSIFLYKELFFIASVSTLRLASLISWSKGEPSIDFPEPLLTMLREDHVQSKDPSAVPFVPAVRRETSMKFLYKYAKQKVFGTHVNSSVFRNEPPSGWSLQDAGISTSETIRKSLFELLHLLCTYKSSAVHKETMLESLPRILRKSTRFTER